MARVLAKTADLNASLRTIGRELYSIEQSARGISDQIDAGKVEMGVQQAAMLVEQARRYLLDLWPCPMCSAIQSGDDVKCTVCGAGRSDVEFGGKKKRRRSRGTRSSKKSLRRW
jgi:hypothetical protein